MLTLEPDEAHKLKKTICGFQNQYSNSLIQATSQGNALSNKSIFKVLFLINKRKMFSSSILTIFCDGQLTRSCQRVILLLVP